VDGSFETLGPREISGLLPRGGTILGTSRTNPYKVEGGVDRVLENFGAQNLAALVAIGGEDPLGVAWHDSTGSDTVVGVQTIDNDLSATDYTFGFDTPSRSAPGDRPAHTRSHNRVMVVEVMGRHLGWIAVMSGIAGGADVILIPEQPITGEQACREIQHRRTRQDLDRRGQRGYELTYESGERRSSRILTPTSSDTSALAGSVTRSAPTSRSGRATRPALRCSGTSNAEAARLRATACSRRATG
jgi:hypothetical protein